MDFASPFIMSVTLPAFFSITIPPDGATFGGFEVAAEDFRMLLLEDVGGCWRLPEDAEDDEADEVAVVVVVAIVVEAVVVAAAAVDGVAAAAVVVAAAAADGVDAAATALFMMGTLEVEGGFRSIQFMSDMYFSMNQVDEDKKRDLIH